MANSTLERRIRRHRRVRKKVHGTGERPRLAVFRSLRHMSAQIIDDDACGGSGKTLCAVTTVGKSFTAEGDKKSQAKALGKLIGERAQAQGVKCVVFDRGGFIYHGRVAAFAEGAREAGLEF